MAESEDVPLVAINVCIWRYFAVLYPLPKILNIIKEAIVIAKWPIIKLSSVELEISANSS